MTVVTGKDFHDLYPDINFYKLTNDKELHHGFQYKTGLNVDIEKFNPTGQCCKGGLYFTKQNKIGFWLGYHQSKYIRRVIIPDTALIYIEEEAFKADKFILEERTLIEDFPLWNDPDFCMTAVIQNGLCLEYIKLQTKKMCRIAVLEHEFAIDYVLDQTEDLCMMAIKQNGYAIQFIKNPTEKMCLEAVKQDGLILEYVENQTEEICIVAVKQDGLALEYVKDQTEEMCKLAVLENNLAERFVKIENNYSCNSIM